MKKFLCDLFNHKMIEITDTERVCKRCDYIEKRLKLDELGVIRYSEWKRIELMSNIAKKGDKVKLVFMEPSSSYYDVIESNINEIHFKHPITKEVIIVNQDTTYYKILNNE